MRTHFLVFLALVIASAPLAAQSNRPEGWRIRTDVPAHDSAVAHQRMPPGWHITTGPSAILYDPGHQANGRFAIETEFSFSRERTMKATVSFSAGPTSNRLPHRGLHSWSRVMAAQLCKV